MTAMKAGLIQIDALGPGGTVVPVRVCNFSDSRVCHLDGQQWDPAIVRLPALRYDFFGGTFQNAVSAPRTSFPLAVDALAKVPPATLATLRFGSARVRIWTGEAGAAFGGYQLRFDGEIKGEPTIEGGIATFTAGAKDAWMDVPLLASYAGSDGLEGPEEITGMVKPLVLGNCRFVPGVLIDPVNNVYQVSAYGAVQAITAAFDRLNSLGPSSGNHASLAALVAAAIPNGSWATCLAQGLVRLGAPADGKPSFHVQGDAAGAGGYVTRAGGMIRRLMELAGGTVNTANLAQLDADRPWDQSLVLREQTTAREQAQLLADSVAAVAGISWLGTFFVKAYGFGTPSITLDTAGTSEPLVDEISQQPVDPPFWRLATTAAITWSVHSLEEIATDVRLRGPYSAARVYRLDDVVSATDGRQFIYTNAVPGAGTAPPGAPATSNSHWSLYGSANATETGIAAGIAGQGALATQNSADFSSQVTGAGKPSEYATRNEDGLNMLPNASIPSAWTRLNGSGIATISTGYAGLPNGEYASLASPNALVFFDNWAPCRPGETLYFSYFIGSDYPGGGLSEPANASVTYARQDGSTYAVNLSGAPWNTSRTLTQASGGTVVTAAIIVPTDAVRIRPYIERPSFSAYTYFVRAGYLGRAAPGADVTGANTAAAISGQGALATQNAADFTTQVTGAGKPANNADVTAANVAAGISGQGALATKNTVGTVDMGDGIVTTVKIGDTAVIKDKIGANAVTAPFIVSTGVQVLSLSAGSLQTVSGLSFAATIGADEVLDLDFMTFPLWSGNDGTRFSLDAILLRDGVQVASFGQIMDTNDLATNNQGGFAVPVNLSARVVGNGATSTYSVQLVLNASVSESNSGTSKTYSPPLDFRLRSSQLRGRRYSR